MPSILVTGANRGLGLAFTRLYADAGWRVHAGCRDPDTADALAAVASNAAGRVSAHRLDVTDAADIAALAESLGSDALDVLVNNAGVSGGASQAFGETDYGRWEETLRVNTLAPMRMAEAFVGHVARSERRLIVCISSRMGSISDNMSGGAYVYRSSKAALNAVVKSLAVDLRRRGIGVVALHPGWVATDMWGSATRLSTAERVYGMAAVIERLTPADSGWFLSYDGSAIPW
ncbi:MAG: SDR family oxidoreductase [Proteobacteria bacterium]|nr:SDR family oxidoreductase [Pseudomonadota bacterium]